MVYQHRSSALKQSNKSHKSAKASKRSHARKAGGKVQGRVGIKSKSSGALIGGDAKANRIHAAKQRRVASKEKLLQQKRLQGRAGGGAAGVSVGVDGGTTNAAGTVGQQQQRRGGAIQVPRVVGLISLSKCEQEMECSVRDYAVTGADRSTAASSSLSGVGSSGGHASVTATYSKYKKEGNLTFLANSTAFYPLYNPNLRTDEGSSMAYTADDASVQAALDLSRVCDTLVFLLDARDATSSSKFDDIVSRRGDRVLAAIKAQGLPTPVTVLVNVEADVNDDDDDDGMSVETTATKASRSSARKKRVDLKRYVTRLATTEFGEKKGSKVLELDLPHLLSSDSPPVTIGGGDGGITSMDQDNTSVAVPTVSPDHNNDDRSHPTRAAFLRMICTMKATPPRWVSDMPRAYLLSDGSSGQAGGGHWYDESTRQLKITGFIRGKIPWNVHDLAHVPNVGTFRVGKIEGTRDLPITAPKRKTKNNKMTMEERNKVEWVPPLLAERKEGIEVESLDMYATPDALDGEQNLIGFDEDQDHTSLDDNDNNDNNDTKIQNGAFEKGVARPAGWGDYQSAWMDAIPDVDNEEAEDHGELAFKLNKKDAGTVATNNDGDIDNLMLTATDAQNNTPEERKALLAQRLKDIADERTFPDEVEVQEDEKAEERFARYRSLKSFRNSYWDPKENLPEEYGRIFHFGCFRATQADVLRDMEDVIDEAAAGGFEKAASRQGDVSMGTDSDDDDDLLVGCVPSGSYVTITLEAVPPRTYRNLPQSTLLTVVTLLQHEHKLSVLHMSLNQPLTNDNDDQTTTETIVKSKDPITFRCGWRTWNSRPVYSQNNLNCDKQKFERFITSEAGAFFAASVLGPVTYSPCPVLAFRDRDDVDNDDDGGKMKRSRGKQLVALGSMAGADADRTVVKRIILTGYPTRVHKRNATVKYMFYNPDDVKWFKPAGLATKHGLQGNILDSIGDHGTMKCLFNAPIKQHDTVCLPLYKRIYPKFAPTEVKNEEERVVSHDIVVL